MLEPEQLRLGEVDDVLQLGTAEENRAVALAMAQQAGSHLYIFTRDLDRAIYDDGDFCDAVARLAREHRRAHIHILVKDSRPAVAYGHRLIQLSQRLSSKIQIRIPSSEYKDYNQAFLVADNTGYIKRFANDRFDAHASMKAPLIARELADFFVEAWERGTPDPQLRRLNI